MMIRKTIRPLTRAELEQLGGQRFPVVTDPWCMRYQEFLSGHPDAKFYRSEIPEHAEVMYCSDPEEGIWFLPGKGIGILQPRGLEMLREIVICSDSPEVGIASGLRLLVIVQPDPSAGGSNLDGKGFYRLNRSLSQRSA